ncbi:DUF7940 domain-containing protein [Paraburkholderia dipogonis]|uniref:DUF7940 domain-containing protein n=1 Tax=Paraburkholderia dipogonis TaxID=1211383 RepID=UPI0038BC59D5
MRLVSYWRRAHKRNSVRALIVGTVAPLITGIWSALPGAFVDRLPLWVVLLISAGISAIGLAGAYTSQPSLQEKNDD